MLRRVIAGLGLALVMHLGTANQARADLISYWSGNGNSNDSVGSNNGTWNGTTAYGQSQQAGQLAFSFNGNSYIQAGSVGLPTGGNDRTLDLWFNITTTPSNEAFFAGYGAFGSNSQAYSLGSNSGGVFFSQWGSAIFGPVPQNGTWYNLAVTTSGNSVNLYFNGVLAETGSLNIDTSSNSNFYIGMIGGDTSRAITGLVDDVGVYDTALSASQIQAIYEATGPQAAPEPSSYALMALGLVCCAVGYCYRRRMAVAA